MESPAGHGYPAAGGLGNGPAGGPGRPAGLAQIVCLALCLLALVVLALCFLMASYPEECRQFWRMLRETRAEGRGNDS